VYQSASRLNARCSPQGGPKTHASPHTYSEN